MTTAYAPPLTDAPADAAPPLDEIRSLVDERGRYEGWIAALEARRGATPAHVLDRVRQDYAGRLARVAAQVAEHAGPLRAHEASLARQHAAVERRLGDERDVLAEVELRALVGEFGADEADQRRAAAQQAIDAIEHDLTGSAARLADVQALVGRVATTAPEPPVAPAAAPQAAAPAPFAPTAGAPAVPSVPAPIPSAPMPTPVQPATATATVAPSAPAAPQEIERESFDFGATGAGFDHGAVDAARVALGDNDRSLTPTFNEAVRSGGGPGAFGFGGAARAAADAGAAGQEKTLRCQECGAMNFPTEWYCEKCGGELAAL